MRYISGDLLDGDWDVAAHVCNNHVVMGAGVALALKNKWPEVYAADKDFDSFVSRTEKRGKFSNAILPDGRKIYNLYAMVGIGNDGHPLNRNCQYDALYDALYRMCSDLSCIVRLSDTVIGVPYLMGCCRAGGSWNIVVAILKDMEKMFSAQFQVYKLEQKL